MASGGREIIEDISRVSCSLNYFISSLRVSFYLNIAVEGKKDRSGTLEKKCLERFFSGRRQGWKAGEIRMDATRSNLNYRDITFL